VTVGKTVEGAGASPDIRVIASKSETGGTGTYTVSASQTVPTEPMTIGGATNDYCCNSFGEANHIMTTSNSGSMIQAAAMVADLGGR
jgi:hypothetical protein